jgi:hypothetical protein
MSACCSFDFLLAHAVTMPACCSFDLRSHMRLVQSTTCTQTPHQRRPHTLHLTLFSIETFRSANGPTAVEEGHLEGRRQCCRLVHSWPQLPCGPRGQQACPNGLRLLPLYAHPPHLTWVKLTRAAARGAAAMRTGLCWPGRDPPTWFCLHIPSICYLLSAGCPHELWPKLHVWRTRIREGRHNTAVVFVRRANLSSSLGDLAGAVGHRIYKEHRSEVRLTLVLCMYPHRVTDSERRAH